MRSALRIGTLSMEAKLNETPTAQKIAAALPLRTSFSTWGDATAFKAVMREREIVVEAR